MYYTALLWDVIGTRTHLGRTPVIFPHVNGSRSLFASTGVNESRSLLASIRSTGRSLHHDEGRKESLVVVDRFLDVRHML